MPVSRVFPLAATLCAATLLISPKPALAVVQTAATQCPAATQESATNLAVNGDFASLSVGGVPVGFSSDFSYVDESVDVGDNRVSIRVGSHAQPFVDQDPFPGDAGRGVSAAANWLYANGNANPTPTMVWSQSVAVTVGQQYTVYLYLSNAIDPLLAGATTASWARPSIGLEIDGVIESQLTIDYESGSDDWSILQASFVASSANATLRLIDYVVSNTVGDDVAIAAVNVRACEPMANFDSDGDGIADSLDLDDDNDGIPDSIEQAAGGADRDSDGDGVVDRLDLDSDNDGLFDAHEAHPSVANLYDTDNNGQLNGQSVGTNGLLDALETTADSGAADYDNDGTADAPVDSDSDGVADVIDLDSDNDGLPDALEGGGSTNAVDGRVPGAVDASGMPLGAAFASPLDSDLDGIADFLDLDSDQDGQSDAIEAGLPDADQDGLVDDFNDANGDGMHDDAVSVLLDSDGDGAPDSREPGDTADDPSVIGGVIGLGLQSGLSGIGSSNPVFGLLLWVMGLGVRALRRQRGAGCTGRGRNFL